MKKGLLLFTALLLFACQGQGSDTPTGSTNEDMVSTKEAKVVGEGAACGVGLDVHCQIGLECHVPEDSLDGRGTCRDSVADKTANCPTNKKPVCGLKDRNKNGYLNACEADRHGAEILDEGLCKADPDVAGSCEAQVRGIGNCEMFVQGYEFDGESCVRIGVSGCNAEIPFPDKASCDAACH